MRLLLFENRSAFAERLAAALSVGGLAHCECDSLSDYERRVVHGDKTPFDAIVLDVRREGNNALPFCRRVVSLSSDLPVVAVTAVDDHDEAVRMVQTGVEDVCLRNEFETDTLRNRIRCAVERYRVHALISREIYAPAVTVSCPAIPGLESLEIGGGPSFARRTNGGTTAATGLRSLSQGPDWHHA